MFSSRACCCRQLCSRAFRACSACEPALRVVHRCSPRHGLLEWSGGDSRPGGVTCRGRTTQGKVKSAGCCALEKERFGLLLGNCAILANGRRHASPEELGLATARFRERCRVPAGPSRPVVGDSTAWDNLRWPARPAPPGLPASWVDEVDREPAGRAGVVVESRSPGRAGRRWSPRRPHGVGQLLQARSAAIQELRDRRVGAGRGRLRRGRRSGRREHRLAPCRGWSPECTHACRGPRRTHRLVQVGHRYPTGRCATFHGAAPGRVCHPVSARIPKRSGVRENPGPRKRAVTSSVIVRGADPMAASGTSERAGDQPRRACHRRRPERGGVAPEQVHT